MDDDSCLKDSQDNSCNTDSEISAAKIGSEMLNYDEVPSKKQKLESHGEVIFSDTFIFYDNFAI